MIFKYVSSTFKLTRLLYNTVLIEMPYYSRIILKSFYNQLFPKLFRYNRCMPSYMHMVIWCFYALSCCCAWLHSDKGMKHLTNVTDWVNLFNVVVIQARKPLILTGQCEAFQCVDIFWHKMIDHSDHWIQRIVYVYTPNWVKVSKFDKNQVYQEM